MPTTRPSLWERAVAAAAAADPAGMALWSLASVPEALDLTDRRHDDERPERPAPRRR
jgi:hypothetical protein